MDKDVRNSEPFIKTTATCGTTKSWIYCIFFLIRVYICFSQIRIRRRSLVTRSLHHSPIQDFPASLPSHLDGKSFISLELLLYFFFSAAKMGGTASFCAMKMRFDSVVEYAIRPTSHVYMIMTLKETHVNGF